MRGATMPAVTRRVEPTEPERVAARHDHARVALGSSGKQGDDVVGHEDADDVGVARGLDVVGLEAVGLGLVAGVVAAHAHDRRRSRCRAGSAPTTGPGCRSRRPRRVRRRSHRDRRRARSRWSSCVFSRSFERAAALDRRQLPRPIFSARCVISSPLDSVLSWMMNFPSRRRPARNGRAPRDLRP